MTVEIRVTDITTVAADVIVNAANERMLGGGGVDGAIHRAAGPELLEACRAVPEVTPGVRCPTGEARITPAFRLPARWVVHTVGPVWQGGEEQEHALLAQCYRSALALAEKHGARSIAFPAISTGVYGFPKEEAAVIAIQETLHHAGLVEHIIHVCFDRETAAAFDRALRARQLD